MNFAEAHDVLGQLPHCDQRVLHAPGECDYCDKSPHLQAARIIWEIAFTGHLATGHQLPCPSDAQRGLGGAHVWPGNIPRPMPHEMVNE
jgi:hypothetical protein